MTADQLRRQIRTELHAARCRDGDHTGPRYYADARELDRLMTEAGHPPGHPTSWGLGNGPETNTEGGRSPDLPPGDTEGSP